VKILAGVEAADGGQVIGQVKVSYKPQYIKADYTGTVRELLLDQAPSILNSSFHQSEIQHPLELKPLFEKDVANLSGGELQRVAIALCLGRQADLYLLDEPSAYLDSNQRMIAARTIRRVLEKEAKAAFVVDHDVYFIDMVSDSLMVFGGTPGRSGLGEGPMDLRSGMNQFLKGLGVTFRRDPDSHRPRINKAGSRLDQEQRSVGEYYYRTAA
jgi:ATP-binding cassette subfamily E protein 1